METFFDVEDGEVENLAPQVCTNPEQCCWAKSQVHAHASIVLLLSV
jgi:hypothetical protein